MIFLVYCIVSLSYDVVLLVPLPGQWSYVIYFILLWHDMCGLVAEWLGCWTCDQQVAGSNPSLSAVECNPGQVVNTHGPLSPSSIIWYQPMGSDALWLGR